MPAFRTFLTRLPLWSPAPARTGVRPVRAGARRRAAAVAVFLGLALVALAQVALGWAVHAERSPLRDPIYFDKLALLRAKRDFYAPPGARRPATVLLVGSSRTLNAVDAGALGPNLTRRVGRPVEAFNFGQAGAGPVTNAVYVRRLIAEGVRPDFVLVEIHPVFLAGNGPAPPETRWLLPIRLRPDELSVVRSMGFPAEAPAVHGPRGFAASWFEYRFLITDRYAPFLLMDDKRLNGGHEPDAHGFARLQNAVAPEDRARLMALARGQYVDYFAGYRPDGIGVNALRDTLGQCRAAGWKAALVLMPESADWLGWYDPGGLREVDRVAAGLAAEFGVPLFDTRRWLPDELTLDGHHLSGPGADAYTDRLAADALAPWLAAGR